MFCNEIIRTCVCVEFLAKTLRLRVRTLELKVFTKSRYSKNLTNGLRSNVLHVYVYTFSNLIDLMERKPIGVLDSMGVV